MDKIVQSEKTKYPVSEYLSHLLDSPISSLNEEDHTDIEFLMSQVSSVQ
jgi:hypothetical protein